MIAEYGTCTRDYDFSGILDLDIKSQLRILEALAKKRTFEDLSSDEFLFAGLIFSKRIDSPGFIPEEFSIATLDNNSKIEDLDLHSKVTLLRYVSGDLSFVSLTDEELSFAPQMLLKYIQNSGDIPQELNPHNW